MKRFPALSLFLACLAAPVVAAAVDTKGPSGWLPDVVSRNGRQIDHLYMHILYIVVAIFLITQGILVYSLIAFRARPGHKARFFHGSAGVEVVLAAVPAVILLYITLVSVRLWKTVRMQEPRDHPVRIQVLAEQFNWNFRYAGPDAVFGTPDDVETSGSVAVPVGRDVVFYLSSKDVIHSFFLPESRVKQDVVPGLLGRVWTKWDVMPVWDLAAQKRVLLTPEEYAAAPVAISGYQFKSEPNPVKKWYQFSDSARINYLRYYYERDPASPLVVMLGGRQVQAAPRYVRHYFELACSQLCGTLHFAMRGQVYVLPPDEYRAWVKAQPRDDDAAAKWAGVWDKVHPEYDRAL